MKKVWVLIGGVLFCLCISYQVSSAVLFWIGMLYLILSVHLLLQS